MTATAAAAFIEGDLIARREGAVGVIRLNRPKAINAVTLEMFRDVDKALDAFEVDPAVSVILLEGAGERGLCAGGDIRALWESSKVKGDLGKILWREEYILNARIKKFAKPYVSFMDGIVMGGGVGLSMHSNIDGWFAHDRMEDIVAALRSDGSEQALATLKTLNEKSPRGMVVTLKLLRLARASRTLEECLVREYRAALEVFASDDFREGVRAAVIDKDRNPKWSPPRIEDVTPAMVAPYFAEIGADELKFT